MEKRRPDFWHLLKLFIFAGDRHRVVQSSQFMFFIYLRFFLGSAEARHAVRCVTLFVATTFFCASGSFIFTIVWCVLASAGGESQQQGGLMAGKMWEMRAYLACLPDPLFSRNSYISPIFSKELLYFLHFYHFQYLRTFAANFCSENKN